MCVQCNSVVYLYETNIKWLVELLFFTHPVAIPEDGIPEQEPSEDNPDERINRELSDISVSCLTHSLLLLLLSEQHRDKRIVREDEYSDSEDEGDEPIRPGNRRRNDHSFRDSKRPRLMEETNAKSGPTNPSQASKPPAVSTGGGALSSPLPPEPSPITPLPQEEGGTSKNKSEQSALCCMHC